MQEQRGNEMNVIHPPPMTKSTQYLKVMHYCIVTYYTTGDKSISFDSTHSTGLGYARA